MLGLRLKMPPFKTGCKIMANPLHQNPRIMEAVKHLYLFSNLSEVAYNKISCTAKYAENMYPLCKRINRYENLVMLMLVLFMLDDHTECDYGDSSRMDAGCQQIWDQVEEALDKLLFPNRRISMTKWRPYVVSLYITLEDMFVDYNEVQKIRFVKYFRDYAKGNVEETRKTNQHGFENVEQFFQVRKMTIGALYTFQLVEYGNDLALTDQQWNDPLMMKYMELGTILMILHNDVLSFEKELYEQNNNLNNMSNSVAVIMLNKNCSVEEAFEETFALNDNYELQFFEAKHQLLSREGNTSDVSAFIEGVEYVLGGAFECGSKLDRYNKVNQIAID